MYDGVRVLAVLVLLYAVRAGARPAVLGLYDLIQHAGERLGADRKGCGGTGGAGVLPEERLGVRGGNLDIPDAGRWEIKFHTKNALLTLFHLEGEPRGHMRRMAREFGWPDEKGRIGFRHAIRDRSRKGFCVASGSGMITVRHDSVSDMVWPYWTHGKIVNAFAAKLRRLTAVEQTAAWPSPPRAGMAYELPQTTLHASAVERGIVTIDFDARTQNGRDLRNHGTKFRIMVDDLHHPCTKRTQI